MRHGHPVVAFDLDGTLLRSTTASLVLADAMGHRPAVEELERLYGAYEIDNHEFATREAVLFTGATPAQIRGHLRSAPWIGGVRETLTALADSGRTLLLATLAWRFAAEELEYRPFFAEVCGAGMELTEGGVLSGRVAQHIDEEGKLAFVARWCEAHGVGLDEIAVVGDSRSDVPLFRAAGTSIALNATADARAVADHALDTEDLRDILPLLDGAV
ncbi:HAD family hydrolase [Streptomyces sp. NPDC003656]|uniref:HAD family hydrolase n=1 Tax=unclassified Streptomyces TaxID=2593676 RepID=UPI0018F64267|nr:HAD-IB family phosphatase [Streptomyces sp. DSM 110735]MBJ7902220.1 HAD family phosphatase [Streptomyces sp. DSM 110735]